MELRREENRYCEVMISGCKEDEIPVELQLLAPPQGKTSNLEVVPVPMGLSPDSGIEFEFDLDLLSDQLMTESSHVAEPPHSAISNEQFVYSSQHLVQNASFHEKSVSHISKNDGILVNIQVKPPNFRSSSNIENNNQEIATSPGSSSSNNLKNQKGRPRKRSTKMKILPKNPSQPKGVPLHSLVMKDCMNNTDLKKKVERAKKAKGFHDRRKGKVEAGGKILELISKYPDLWPVLNENPIEMRLFKTHFPHLVPKENNQNDDGNKT